MEGKKLFLLPGLGADQDLFYPQIDHFEYRLEVLSPEGESALWAERPCMTAAANVLLADLIGKLPDSGDYVLGGMSFGGSLAMEMTRLMVQDNRCQPPKALVLIASNRTDETITKRFRINRAVGSMLPRWMIRRSLKTLSGLFARRESLSEDDAVRLRNMAGRVNIDQLLWGAAAIASWKFTEEDVILQGVPIHQIHGQHDWVIPMEPKHATSQVDDGRHLITWTHREKINGWLQSIMESPLGKF